MNRTSWAGQILGGRYQIQDMLGQGGMSAVYKAMDSNLKRVVAVKLIHAHLSNDPKFIDRFEDEAQAVAQLRHPNIVQVFDFNHDNETYYMVQEFVPGETLQGYLERLNKAGRPMPLEEAVKYMMEVCNALGYAHERGIIHRDIKPANIMIDVQGKAILMDFGIVKIMGGVKHTTTGAIIGTAMYMAPDVIRGEMPDARSDIYSLGVTLFEMVSGHPPFDAESVMTLMMMHLNDPVPDLSRIRPEVPPELKAVIEKSLAKQRKDRFATAYEMANALKRVLDNLAYYNPEKTHPITSSTVPPNVQSAMGPTQDVYVAPVNPQYTGASAYAPAPGTASNPAYPAPGTSASGTVRVGDGTGMNTGMGAGPAYPSMTGQTAGGQAATGFGAPAAPPRKFPVPIWLIGGAAGLLILACLAAVLVSASGMFGGNGAIALLGGKPSATTGVKKTPTLAATTPAPTTLAVNLLPSATNPPAASATPQPTATLPQPPTPVIPKNIPFVQITSIKVDDKNRYVVSYETFQYTEKLPGVHVHFFFNTVTPDQAGMPGKGPWIVYGGPRPFTEYKTSDRPANAAEMCALVANSNHSVQPNSGVCYPLPDVPTVTARVDTVCRLGPGENFDIGTMFDAGSSVLLRGLSEDEIWVYIQNPDELDASCWVPTANTVVGGDISQVPLVPAPPSPTPNTLTVEITAITVNSNNQFVVEFTANGFTPTIPGTHIHFFFDTVPVEQIGIGGGGERKMYGGPSPFVGYAVVEMPQQAKKICAIVANPDHSVIPGSGNCFDLPSVIPTVDRSRPTPSPQPTSGGYYP